MVFAIILGFIFSYYSNNDKLHKFLRDKNITRETSYASEWFGAFLKNVTYIVLHLKDGRRLYGWPREWPTDPKNGHFVIEQASWLEEDNEIELEEVNQVLIDTSQVELVEFMEKSWENKKMAKKGSNPPPPSPPPRSPGRGGANENASVNPPPPQRVKPPPPPPPPKRRN